MDDTSGLADKHEEKKLQQVSKAESLFVCGSAEHSDFEVRFLCHRDGVGMEESRFDAILALIQVFVGFVRWISGGVFFYKVFSCCVGICIYIVKLFQRETGKISLLEHRSSTRRSAKHNQSVPFT